MLITIKVYFSQVALLVAFLYLILTSRCQISRQTYLVYYIVKIVSKFLLL